MAGCPAFDPTAPFLRAATEVVDCRALAIGEDGYHALSHAGSPFGVALTGVLTLFVALQGYRMVLGVVPSLRASIVTIVKLGFVLALATQWQAYRVLAYDVVVRGPANLVGQLIGPADAASGSTGSLIDRAETVQQSLDASARRTPTVRLTTPTPTPVANSLPPSTGAEVVRFPNLASRSAQILLLVTTLAGLLSVRLVAGVLLGLGPLFVASALFEGSRGLFVGWLRGLAGAFLAAIGVPLVMAIELIVIGPQALALQRLGDTPETMPTLPSQILATAAVFAIVMTATLLALARAASALRWPQSAEPGVERPAGRIEPIFAPNQTPTPVTLQEAPRVRAVADAVAAIDRRERRTLDSRRNAVGAPTVTAHGPGSALGPEIIAVAGRDRRQDRQTISATRRDARS